MIDKLDASFYARSAIVVASELLGKILVRNEAGHLLRARIVEVEAYLGALDEASHAHRGLTSRNSVMFGPAGHIYIYFTYGMHFCMNVVTGADGAAEAVLLRAAEPLEGISIMERNRNLSTRTDLCNGPAKLVQAFGLGRSDNGRSLLTPELYIESDGHKPEIAVSRRIGITRAVDAPLRYFISGSKYVSHPSSQRLDQRDST